MSQQLENYLEEVRKHLKGLPSATQQEELEEIRQHLRMLVATKVEQGALESEATAIALKQFGSAHHVGRELQRSLKPRVETPLRIALVGIGAVFFQCIFSVALVILVMFISAFIFQQRNAESAILHPVTMSIVAFCVKCLSPFLTGWFATSFAPKRGFIAVIITSIILAIMDLLNDSPNTTSLTISGSDNGSGNWTTSLSWYPWAFTCAGALAHRWFWQKRINLIRS